MPGDSVAYTLIDTLFARKFLMEYSWGGGSRKDRTPKRSFKQFLYFFKFFWQLVKSADSTYTAIQLQHFFQTKLLPNCGRRAVDEVKRAPRTKFRSSLLPKREKPARKRSAVTYAEMVNKLMSDDDDDGGEAFENDGDEKEVPFETIVRENADIKFVPIETNVTKNAEVKVVPVETIVTENAGVKVAPVEKNMTENGGNVVSAKYAKIISPLMSDDAGEALENDVDAKAVPVETNMTNVAVSNAEITTDLPPFSHSFINLGEMVQHHIINKDNITTNVNQIFEEVEIVSKDPLSINDGNNNTGDYNAESIEPENGTGSSDEEEPKSQNDAVDNLDEDEIEDEKQIQVSSFSAAITFSCNNERDYFRHFVVWLKRNANEA